ncbi:MAG: FtsW/RodA/SpoVE family cell cycle protein, partial [Parvibaculaceae bacterium]
MLDLRRFTGHEMRLTEKLIEFNWAFLLLLALIASIGFAMLYSVAEGSFTPWAFRQAARFGVGVCIMISVAMVDLRLWMRLAYPLYGVALAMLVAVEVIGFVGMGAQRWLDLGFISIQPSEVMKVTLILALARYFHGLTLEEVSRLRNLLVPLALVGTPVGLVVLQPDLGTAILLIATGGVLFFSAGLRWRYFIFAGAAVLAAIPVIWSRLHDYQRNRVFTFLDPERYPLGTVYHILQSKIALGSGGIFGKGFMEGTQSQLNFLPEKHTDFIFTMLGEELGLVGGIVL